MDRRRFLGLFGAGVAGIALEQAIPLGRVWSFPKKIVIAPNDGTYGFGRVTKLEGFPPFRIGDTIRVKVPERFIVKNNPLDFSHPSRYRTVTLVQS